MERQNFSLYCSIPSHAYRMPLTVEIWKHFSLAEWSVSWQKDLLCNDKPLSLNSCCHQGRAAKVNRYQMPPRICPSSGAPTLALLLPSTSAIFLKSGPAALWLLSSSYWKLAVRRLMSLCGLACRKRATRCGVWALKQDTWWGWAPSASLTTRCSCPARST